VALNPNVVVVASGDLITAAHHNNVRANLDRLDTTKVLKAGDVMTGQLTLSAANLILDNQANYATIGKTSAALATTGIALGGPGWVRSTIDAAGGTNLALQRQGAASANAQPFAQFSLATQGVIGSITQVNTSGVAFNTTSDQRLKTDAGPVDWSAIEADVLALQVRRFTRIDDPDAGEHVGLFAQEAAQVTPDIVAEGVGAPGDDGFVPWGIDYSRLVPRLLAQVQYLTGRVAALEAAA
jgi:Chaperone of endosialidase